MLIGLLKEIKDHEYRVALTPDNVQALVGAGHCVWVESSCGVAVGFSDKDYEYKGAKIIEKVENIFAQAEFIVKVKEPDPEECLRLRKNQMIFAFLHLAANPLVADLLLESGCIAFAYETVTDSFGHLPLLKPMSAIAGRFSVQAGAHYLEKNEGGRGILLGGLSKVPASKVLILGAGNAGSQALDVAFGMGAEVTILDQSLKHLNKLKDRYKDRGSADFDKGDGASRIHIGLATEEKIAESVTISDLLIGTVLSPGAKTPQLVTRSMIQTMKQGSVIVDVSIDQGGCFETSRPTTHSAPVYVEEGIIHYCVTNMPGAVPLTSTLALSNVTLPFIMLLANLGYRKACIENPYLREGLNIYKGQMTHSVVAKALNKDYINPEQLLGEAG